MNVTCISMSHAHVTCMSTSHTCPHHMHVNMSMSCACSHVCSCAACSPGGVWNRMFEAISTIGTECEELTQLFKNGSL